MIRSAVCARLDTNAFEIPQGLSSISVQVYICIHTDIYVTNVRQYGNLVCQTQEAKYVEGWPITISAWAGWSRFDIPVDRHVGVHSLLICTSITLGSITCH
jgi:hypothetical protein